MVLRMQDDSCTNTLKFKTPSSVVIDITKVDTTAFHPIFAICHRRLCVLLCISAGAHTGPFVVPRSFGITSPLMLIAAFSLVLPSTEGWARGAYIVVSKVTSEKVRVSPCPQSLVRVRCLPPALGSLLVSFLQEDVMIGLGADFLVFPPILSRSNRVGRHSNNTDLRSPPLHHIWLSVSFLLFLVSCFHLDSSAYTPALLFFKMVWTWSEGSLRSTTTSFPNRLGGDGFKRI